MKATYSTTLIIFAAMFVCVGNVIGGIYSNIFAGIGFLCSVAALIISIKSWRI